MTGRRNTNIEILRILCTFGVILLHLYGFNGGGGVRLYETTDLDALLCRLIEVFFSVAVNIFVLIFAFFNYEKRDAWRKKLQKIIYLLVIVVFYRILSYSITVCIGMEEFETGIFLSKFLPINWYIICYVGLYIISGYLDYMVSQHDIKQLRVLNIVFFLVISAEPYMMDFLSVISGREFTGIAFVGAYGDQAGYTLINFILIYVIGASIKRIRSFGKAKYTRVFYFASLALLFMNFIFFEKYGRSNVALYYCNPILIINAACLFNIALDWKIDRNFVINLLSKASITVYLTHAVFVEIVLYRGELFFDIIADKSVFIAEIVTAVIIYVMGIGIHFIFTRHVQKMIFYVYECIVRKITTISHNSRE